jgi:hypothetical protein
MINSSEKRLLQDAYHRIIAEGYPEHIAADLTEMGFHSYEEWREHYLHYGDNRSSDYHEQQVRY